MIAILGFFLIELLSQSQTRRQTEFAASSQTPQCDPSTEKSTFLMARMEYVDWLAEYSNLLRRELNAVPS